MEVTANIKIGESASGKEKGVNKVRTKRRKLVNIPRSSLISCGEEFHLYIYIVIKWKKKI